MACCGGALQSFRLAPMTGPGMPVATQVAIEQAGGRMPSTGPAGPAGFRWGIVLAVVVGLVLLKGAR